MTRALAVLSVYCAVVLAHAQQGNPPLPVEINLDPNRPRPLFFMTAHELADVKKRLAEGEAAARSKLKSIRHYADRAMADPDDAFARPGRKCKFAALTGLWTGETRYLDWSRQVLLARADVGPGTASEAHNDHYHNNFYSFLEAYDYLLAANALTVAQRTAIERGYFRASMAVTRDHWASKACDNHGVVEDEAAVLAGACLQDAELLRFGLERTFHHLAHDVLDDGVWYQESMLVHDMNVSRFLRIIRACLNSGIDLRTVGVAPIPRPPYPGNTETPHSFGMMAEAMLRLATHDLKIPCSGYYSGLYPYIPARTHTLSEMLTWQRGRLVTPDDVVTEIRALPSTLLPCAGFAALRAANAQGRTYAMFQYGPTDHHLGAMNFVLWADNRFLTADFSRIDGWATPLYRAYVEKTWSHNCVVVDGESQNQQEEGICATHGGRLVGFAQNGNVAAAHARATALYDDVTWDRTLLLTPDYLLCLDELDAESPHTYDWMYHFACPPEAVSTPLRPASEPSEIVYPHFAERRGYEAQAQILFTGDCEGVRVALRVLGEPGDQIVTAECPARIKQEPDSPLVEDVGKVVLRRRMARTRLIAVFEPLRGRALTEGIAVSEAGSIRIACRDGRMDTIQRLPGPNWAYVWVSNARGADPVRVELRDATEQKDD